MGSIQQGRAAGIVTLVSVAMMLFAAWHWAGPESPTGGALPTLGPDEATASEPELVGLKEESSGSRSLASIPADRQTSLSADVPAPAHPTSQRGTATLTVDVHLPGDARSQGIEVLLESARVNAPPGFDSADTRGVVLRERCSPEGRAAFDGLPFGSYRVSAHDGAGAVDALELVFNRNTRRSLHLSVVGPEEGLVVRVQDVQGAGIPNADVKVTGGIRNTKVVGMYGEPGLSTRTDSAGRAVLPGVEMTGALVYAEAADGRRGCAVLRGLSARASEDMKARAVTVTVDQPGVITGQLLGRPAGWAGTGRVTAWALTRSHPYYATFGQGFECQAEGDRYTIEGLPPGRYSLTFEDSGGLRVDYPAKGEPRQSVRNSLAPIDVTVEAGMTTVQNLNVLPGATLSGVVRTAAGAPLAGALIKTTYTPMTSNFPDGFVVHGARVWRLDSDSASLAKHPLTHRNVRTDSQGRYRIPSLPVGKLRVEVIVQGMSYDRREAVELLDGEELELEHVLVPAGSIEGIEPGGGYLGARRRGEAVPVHIAILPGTGSFFFPGLAPGRYEILGYRSDESIPPVLLTEVTVKAGETTWVDLREAPRPNKYEFRFSNPYGPIFGAQILPPGRVWKRTDADGRVAFESTFPLTIPITTKVMRGPVKYQLSVAEFVEDQGVMRSEVSLGDEPLQLRTLGANGSASAAQLTILSGEFESDVVQRASTKALNVGSEGVLDLQHLVPGRYRVSAIFPSGAEVSATADIPSVRHLDLQEYPTGDLSLVVTDANGERVKNARIYITWPLDEGNALGDSPPGTEERGSRSAAADAEGKALVRGLPAGPLSVRVGAPRASWARQGPTVTQEIELREGDEARLTFTVER